VLSYVLNADSGRCADALISSSTLPLSCRRQSSILTTETTAACLAFRAISHRSTLHEHLLNSRSPPARPPAAFDRRRRDSEFRIPFNRRRCERASSTSWWSDNCRLPMTEEHYVDPTETFRLNLHRKGGPCLLTPPLPFVLRWLRILLNNVRMRYKRILSTNVRIPYVGLLVSPYVSGIRRYVQLHVFCLSSLYLCKFHFIISLTSSYFSFYDYLVNCCAII